MRGRERHESTMAKRPIHKKVGENESYTRLFTYSYGNYSQQGEERPG